MVVRAGHGSNLDSRESLARLCAAYWQPVYAFIQKKGFGPEEARDYTQGFFTRLIEKEYLRDIYRSKGKFRSFVLASVSHFLSNHFDSLRAQKRGGGRDLVPLDGGGADPRWDFEPAHTATPEALFEYQWALTVLERAIERLREDYAPAEFHRLKPFLLGETAHGDLAAAARRLNVSEGSLKVAVHRMRKRFRQTLRAEIAGTVADPREVDSEVRYLIEVLSRGGSGRQV